MVVLKFRVDSRMLSLRFEIQGKNVGRHRLKISGRKTEETDGGGVEI